MKFIITAPENFSTKTASEVSNEIVNIQKKNSRNINIVFATGNTMIGFLDKLSKSKEINWQRVEAYHLDEYKGLDINHPCSFAYFLQKNIFSKIDIPKENIHFIDGSKPDLPEYMKMLKKMGGADIIILGVGMDGHLAFNEPPEYSNFRSRIQEVKLLPSTIEANQNDYPEITKNPFAYTMGMADIIEGKHIFFFANKSKKAEIVRNTFYKPVTEEVPASILQKHPNVTVILDSDAARLV